MMSLRVRSGGDEPDLAPVQSTVSMTTVAAVAIAMLVALLIVIDVSCYFINACGLTMCVCVHLCGHEAGTTYAKPTSDKDADDPERYDLFHIYIFMSPQVNRQYGKKNKNKNRNLTNQKQ